MPDRLWYSWQDGCCPNCGEPGDPPLYVAPGAEVDGLETDGVVHCGCYYEAEPEEVHYHFSEGRP